MDPNDTNGPFLRSMSLAFFSVLLLAMFLLPNSSVYSVNNTNTSSVGSIDISNSRRFRKKESVDVDNSGHQFDNSGHQFDAEKRKGGHVLGQVIEISMERMQISYANTRQNIGSGTSLLRHSHNGGFLHRDENILNKNPDNRNNVNNDNAKQNKVNNSNANKNNIDKKDVHTYSCKCI